MNGYEEFVASKLAAVAPTGIDATQDLGGYDLMPHQTDLTAWALRRGRAAIFADTGLGKTRMQLAWADRVHAETGCDVLILAPLAVAAQTVAEGEAIGVPVTLCREASDLSRGINITNYDRLHKFDPSRFGAVVLDESSCIKHHDTKTLARLLEAFADTRFKLCATATPAPNDWTELGTHAEFLGVCTRAEMLAEYFVHDGGETQVWRLKGHAREQFWRWVSGWGAMVRKPSDLGHDDSAYNLPDLTVSEHTVASTLQTAGQLFAFEAQTLSERRDARKDSMDRRIEACVQLIKAEWSKLAAHNEDYKNGLETGVRGSEESEGEIRPGIQGETERPVGERPTTTEGIHAGVLQGQPGEVRADHAGTASQAQRGSAGAVCDGRRVAQCAQGVGKGLAGIESGQAESAAPESARSRSERLSGHVDSAERQVRDLRLFGHEQPECVSSGGSLPQDGQGSRVTLHGVQSGAGEISGRCRSVDGGSGVRKDAWIIWCELNSEQDLLERHFGGDAFSVRGSMTPEEKEAAILGWVAGERPVMISKPSIMGWGINAQHCARVAFVGVTDSFEAYYQAVRRCWRFGQKREVQVHIFASELEGSVVANLRRKESDALAMAESLSAETRDAVRAEVRGQTRNFNHYMPTSPISAPAWLITEAA